MKRRNDRKKLTLDPAAIRELTASDFEGADGAALSQAKLDDETVRLLAKAPADC